MKLETSLRELNTLLHEMNPEKITVSWILTYSPKTYRTICKYARTPLNTIDWDLVTSYLDRSFQKRFVRYKSKLVKQYENKDEITKIFNTYKDKLYVCIAPCDEEERNLRNKIFTLLVRLSQKGNILAEQELTEWILYITNEWSDKYPQIWKWRGREDEVRLKIKACIRCYKYTGSFLGYLFKTLEYSARGLPYEISLDDPVGEDGATKIDFVSYDEDLRSASLFGR
jgi:hypothetical protein